MQPGDKVHVTFLLSPPLEAVVVEPGDVWTDVRETLADGYELTHRLLTKHMTVIA